MEKGDIWKAEIVSTAKKDLDILHKKYDFEKTQEILGNDIIKGLHILEENRF